MELLERTAREELKASANAAADDDKLKLPLPLFVDSLLPLLVRHSPRDVIVFLQRLKLGGARAL